MTLAQWERDAVSRLDAAGAFDGATDAQLMLCDALHISRGMLRILSEMEIPEDARGTLDAWLAERLTGRPLQYCEKVAWFYGRAFFVDERVLIPRFDTEILCEEALKRYKNGMKVLDLCTGSGILAVTISLERRTRVIAADIDEGAMAVTRLNAEKLGADVETRQGDLWDAVKDEVFDMIVCNPPYLTGEDMENLQNEVTYEPKRALYGGEDGLSFYRRLAEGAKAHLAENGMLLMEIGCLQGQTVSEIFNDYREVHILKDLQGLDRVVCCGK